MSVYLPIIRVRPGMETEAGHKIGLQNIGIGKLLLLVGALRKILASSLPLRELTGGEF